MPDNPAVIFGKQKLTYQEINKRANQIAHYLQRHGAGPDVPVGIYLERSAELVVAILGILKAGSPYVPLDTNLPDGASYRNHPRLGDEDADYTKLAHYRRFCE